MNQNKDFKYDPMNERENLMLRTDDINQEPNLKWLEFHTEDDLKYLIMDLKKENQTLKQQSIKSEALEKIELYMGTVYTLQRDVMELKDRVKRLFEVTHALELNYANLENRLDQMELKLMDQGVIPNRQSFVEHNGTKPAFAVRRTSDLDLYND